VAPAVIHPANVVDASAPPFIPFRKVRFESGSLRLILVRVRSVVVCGGSDEGIKAAASTDGFHGPYTANAIPAC
jgi:hypothetical protein